MMVSSHDLTTWYSHLDDEFGVLVKNPNGLVWFEGPNNYRGAQETAIWFSMLGCDTIILPVNPKEFPNNDVSSNHSR